MQGSSWHSRLRTTTMMMEVEVEVEEEEEEEEECREDVLQQRQTRYCH